MKRAVRKPKAAAPGWLGADPRSLWLLVASALVGLAGLQLMAFSDSGKATASALPTLVVQALLWMGLGVWAWTQGRLDGLSWDRALAWALTPLLLAGGTLRAAVYVSDIVAVLPIAAANLLFWWAALAPRFDRPWVKWQAEENAPEGVLSEGAAWAWGLGLSVGVGLAVLWIRNWAINTWTIETSDFQWLYVPRWRGFSGAAGGVFSDYSLLRFPIIFSVLLLAAAALLRYAKARTAAILGLLFVLTVAGKFYFTKLSVSGLGTFAEKNVSEHNNFYTIAVRHLEGDGIKAFLDKFSELMQPSGNQQETHPPGGTVFYAGLVKLLGKDPGAIGRFLAVFYGLAIVPLYFLAARLGGSPWAGFAVVLLYLSSPFNLQLSAAGVEPLVLMLSWASLWALVEGLERRKLGLVALAGLLNWLACLNSFATLSFLMFMSLWVLVRSAAMAAGPGAWLKDALKALAAFFGAFLGAWLLTRLALGSGFQYLKWLEQGNSRLARNTALRPYALWVWANVVLYIGYAGVAVVGLYLAQTGRWILGGLKGQAALALAQGSLLLYILLALGRAENQHNMHWAVLFLLLPCAGWMLRPQAKKQAADDPARLRFGLLLALVGLNLLNSAVIFIKVLDFW